MRKDAGTRVVAVASIAVMLAATGAPVRAQDPAAAAGAAAGTPLRFTLDSRMPAPDAKAQVRLGRSTRDEQRFRLQQGQPPGTESPAGDWNCGMPIVRPPADFAPAPERPPDDRQTYFIRRATPRACGR
jgi:hypothetical protein